MDADGRNAWRLTNDQATDRFPTWSPDGNHIVFDRVNDNSDIVLIEIPR